VTRVSRRVFLHVGLPKSGTTYVQAVLDRNRELLKERSRLLFPGDRWGRQVQAVRDVRNLTATPAERRSVAGAWDRLVAEVRAWDGDAVVSMEWLCTASPEEIERILGDLAPAQVHVVFTVRDLGRTVPAAWQEFCQNRRSWTWAEFLDQVTGPDPMDTPAGWAFWKEQDMALLLERWSAQVPTDRLHVVTLPPGGADPALLWHRFAQVLDVDPAGLDLDVSGSNASLGLESAELMRRANRYLQEQGLDRVANHRLMKHQVAKQILSTRKKQESKLVLPARHHDWARAAADRQIAAIAGSGTAVVGSLEELQPVLTEGDGTPHDPTEPDPDAVLDAAVQALVTVVLDRSRSAGGTSGAARTPDRAARRAARGSARRLAGAVRRRLGRPGRAGR
jgi:hypothetical protein